MIIWGLRNRGNALGQIQLTCPNCHRAAMTSLAQTRRWFTLFFIPLFPIGAKQSIAVCGLCGFRYQVDNAQAESLVAQATPGTLPPSRV